jgi:hypothetical protein
LLLLGARADTTPAQEPGRSFLETSFKLTGQEFARIDSGEVLSRTLEVTDPREVATLGLVRIKVTPDFYVERLADITDFKRDEAVLQIGTFGNPPVLGDVAGLTLDDADFRNLRDCRVGDCGVQLSADAIDRFRKDVDWQRADARGQATSLMQQVLVEYVTRYVEAGSAASGAYADTAHAVNPGREFASLVDAGTDAWQYFPGLRRHLLVYPAATSAGIVDMVYWSKESVNRRPVVSVTHLAISRAGEDTPADYVIASKQVYGTHYYDASLGLTVLVRDRSGSSPATYVAYLNRSRVDVFGGILGRLARKLVSVKARSVVTEQLGRLQLTLERQFAVGQAASVAAR